MGFTVRGQSLCSLSVYTQTTTNVFTQCYCVVIIHWNKAFVELSVSDINREELVLQGADGLCIFFMFDKRLVTIRSNHLKP